jgi:predicted alpha/beta superfamily hydrolase
MSDFRTANEALAKGLPVPSATAEDHWECPAVETHLLRSTHVAQTFKLEVAQPPRRRGDSRRLPVVYVTDGNMVFNLFKEYSHLLQNLGLHPFPSFILVGIGYPSNSQFAGMYLRIRDFTTPDYFTCDMDAVQSAYSRVEGVLFPETGAKRYHGSEDFCRFIEQELVPFIDANYETIPHERTYFGHSGGGLLGLYALCTRAHLFKNYIVSSPGFLSYKGDDFGFRMVRELIASGRGLDSIKLYLSVGAEEDFQPSYFGEPQLTANFHRLAAMLKEAAIPGLDLITEVFPGEVHMSVWPVAFVHGVQAVFGLRRTAGLY